MKVRAPSPCRVGDARQRRLDQRAADGAPGREIGGEAEDGRLRGCLHQEFASTKAGDQPIDVARFLHLRNMPDLVENMDRHLAGKRLGMRDRDDAVVAAPDDLHRHRERGERRTQVERLAAVREPGARDRVERGGNPVEPLVTQRLLDHRAADQRRIVDQRGEQFLRFAAPLYLDKAVDERAVDLRAEPGRGEQGQRGDPPRHLPGQHQRDRAAHRMPDKVEPLDAERGERIGDGGGKSLGVAGTDLLDRAAMPRQVERDDAPCRSASAGWLNIQALRSAPNPCTSTIGARRRPRRYRGHAAAARRPRSRAARPRPRRSERGFEAGSGATNPATKASISLSGTSGGADTASSAPIGSVAPEAATMRRKVPGSLASKTLVIFVVSISSSSSPAPEAVALLLQPAEDLPLGHRQTPFRHRDRGDVAHRQTSRCGRGPVARVFPACRARAGEGRARAAMRTD